MTVKKLTVEHLRKLVKEAVAAQIQEKKLTEAKKAAKLKESKTVRLTMEQLRTMVKEAVSARLSEDFGVAPNAVSVGDLVAYRGKTGYVTDIEADGKIRVTSDGIRDVVLDSSEVQQLESADELEGLDSSDLDDINSGMGFNVNHDPGGDRDEELEHLRSVLDTGLLNKNSRSAIERNIDDLESK